MRILLPLRPETPTLPEQLIARIRLPYLAGCIVLGYVITIVLPLFLVEYVDKGSVSNSVGLSLSPQNITSSLFLAYLFYAPRFMRKRLLRSEGQLSKLLPGGEEDFHRLFGKLASVRSQVAIWAAFTFLLLVEFNIVPFFLPASPQTASDGIIPTTLPGTVLSMITGILQFAITTLVISSLAWVYYSVLRGIHKMGDTSLNLTPFYKDPFLGLKPIGSLALSLAAAYFGFEIFFIAAGIASPPSLADYITVGGLLIGLVGIGILAFFLPLRRLHAAMTRQKTLQRTKLGEKLTPIFESTSPVRDSETGEMMRLYFVDKKISSIATWPFDFQIIGKLTIILLSVTAALLTRFIATVLKL